MWSLALKKLSYIQYLSLTTSFTEIKLMWEVFSCLYVCVNVPCEGELGVNPLWVSVHCAARRLVRVLTFSCSVIIANMLFLMDISSVTPKSSSRQAERDPVITARIICFSNFLEWRVWPFDVPPLVQLRSSLSSEKVAKLDKLSHKLSASVGAETLFGL